MNKADVRQRTWVINQRDWQCIADSYRWRGIATTKTLAADPSLQPQRETAVADCAAGSLLQIADRKESQQWNRAKVTGGIGAYVVALYGAKQARITACQTFSRFTGRFLVYP